MSGLCWATLGYVGHLGSLRTALERLKGLLRVLWNKKPSNMNPSRQGAGSAWFGMVLGGPEGVLEQVEGGLGESEGVLERLGGGLGRI
eukprot:8429389-Karenia_brevis.AAC.1